MDVKEKLVKLLRVARCPSNGCDFCDYVDFEDCRPRFLADYLLAHDVTIVKHGRWLYDGERGKYFCSVCDEYALSFKKDTLYGDDLYDECLTDYCPSCGAIMDEDKEINK